MSLGHLWEFEKFDFDRFFAEKACEVVGFQTWDEYRKGADGKSEKTGVSLGVRVVCSILSDNTKYNLRKTELSFSNRLKEITFKIKCDMSNCPVKIGDKVCGSAFTPQGGFYLPVVQECTAYGQNGFKNELSILVSDFKLIEKKK